MRFRAHDTFFIRKGWLTKGLKNVNAKADVFTNKKENPMDVLGIGANMVKALRYWMIATNLTEEVKGKQRVQKLTSFGELVYEYDSYFEELGTLWSIHYQLCKNDSAATSWHYFFNLFNLNEFTKEDFTYSLNKYLLHEQGESKPERTLDDDFTCIINTYMSRMKSSLSKIHPENNIDCPLTELGLVDYMNRSKKTYRKVTPSIDSLDPLIILSVILDQSKGKNTDEILISSILNDKSNAGRIFCLDNITLISLLYKLELLGFVELVRTAGLDVVKIKTEWDYITCIREYYKSLNEQNGETNGKHD